MDRLALRSRAVASGYIAKSVSGPGTVHSGTAEGLPAGGTGGPAFIRETVVVRVNFTPDDVARTRFTVAPAPLIETALAMVGLRRAASTRVHVGTSSWVIE